MSKQFWGVVVVIILIFVGIFALSGKKSDTTSSSGSTAGLSQHVEGNLKSNVSLVEYGDYECPYCGQYYPTVKAVETEFNDQIKFQFRNFPLVSVHQNAFAGARAAEAASLQNKFWEMHDVLYENQDAWSTASDPTTYFKQYATELGLNTTQFQTDYASSKVNDVINADMAEGNKLNIQGTPTFYLDGKQIQVANTTASFEKVIKQALADQKVTSSGTTTQSTKNASASSTNPSTANGSASTSTTNSTTTSGQ